MNGDGFNAPPPPPYRSDITPIELKIDGECQKKYEERFELPGKGRKDTEKKKRKGKERVGKRRKGKVEDQRSTLNWWIRD